jgi:hypothetical protein
MIQAKFGLTSGFRGEDFWKSLQTDDGCQLMAIAHTGELKIAVYVDLDRLNMFAVSTWHLSLIVFEIKDERY